MTPYCDTTYATAYFGDRCNSDAWTGTDNDKGKALKTATRMIDRYCRFFDEQGENIRFDPDAAAAVPDELKQATCEQALYLLNLGTIDPTQPTKPTINGVGSMSGMVFDKNMRAARLCDECRCIIEHMGGEVVSGAGMGASVGKLENW